MKTKMSGFFQTVFYFGYMAMFCLGLATLCGTRLLLFPFGSSVCLGPPCVNGIPPSFLWQHNTIGCLTTFPSLSLLSLPPTRRDRLHRHVDVREEDLHHDQGRLGAPLTYSRRTTARSTPPPPRARTSDRTRAHSATDFWAWWSGGRESEGRERKKNETKRVQL